MNPSRRKFIKNSAKFVAVTSLASAIPGPVSCSGPNDRIVLGAIGVRNQGYANLNGILGQPNVELAGMCDIDEKILNGRAGQIEEQYGMRPKLYSDFRNLLEDKDIDAVIISTPDHWHCLMMVMALEAGKHVYVEKPLANSIEETRIMQMAARKHRKKIVTVGQWQRSGKHWQDAIDFIHSGELGVIGRVKAWAYTAKPKLPAVQNEPVPQGVDYNMWLGPAPDRPFNKNHFHYNFRYFWDYAGGLMTDWGVHMLDYALYGMKATVPQSILASGGRFSYPEGARQTPDTLNILYDFEDFVISWEHSVNLGIGPEQKSHGVLFQGTNGTLLVTRNGWEVFAEKSGNDGFKVEAVPHQAGTGGFREHFADFTQAIRNGKTPNCPVETAKIAADFAHMGNIAYRTGETLTWDHKNNRFKGSLAANSLLAPIYRDPWTLPPY
jgi:predicted dehydrogenase